jgi:DsbC/DsbD-like thiol-disulfide interchange protein
MGNRQTSIPVDIHTSVGASDNDLDADVHYSTINDIVYL